MKTNTPQFIISLSRPIEVFSDNSSDLDGMSIDELKEVIIELKKKELTLDIKINKLSNVMEDAYDFIHRGANLHTNSERIDLEEKIRNSLDN
jgi:hypothetical protein